MNVLIAKLKVDFAMKDFGPLGYFLGIQAIRDTNVLHLTQTKYILDLLNHTHMAESKPYRVPCTAGSKMSKYDGEILPDPTEYRTIVGALQYVTLTRPDIAYSVNQLSQHMHVPTLSILQQLKESYATSRALSPLVYTIAKGQFISVPTMMLTG
jgi:hypothetical protein